MKDDIQYINFSGEVAREFKRNYEYAKADDMYSFMFDGKEVLTDYAKYVIEYLTNKGLLPKGG